MTVSAIRKQRNETNYFNVDNISMSTESNYMPQLSHFVSSLQIVNKNKTKQINALLPPTVHRRTRVRLLPLPHPVLRSTCAFLQEIFSLSTDTGVELAFIGLSGGSLSPRQRTDRHSCSNCSLHSPCSLQFTVLRDRCAYVSK